MPAARQRYYDAKDVEMMLKIGHTKAYAIFSELNQLGLLFVHDGTRRVKIDVFEKWLEDHEGAEKRYKDRLDELARGHVQKAGKRRA